METKGSIRNEAFSKLNKPGIGTNKNSIWDRTGNPMLLTCETFV